MTALSERPLGPRVQQVADLLLEGCDNAEIAQRLHMARRTVKAHMNRLFLRYGIRGGIKRVKLATLLYRRQQLCSQSQPRSDATNIAATVHSAIGSVESSSL